MSKVIKGDCIIALEWFEDSSVDAIVTDPPYGLSFMGKKWDYDVPSSAIWKEALRVLKPGGHLLSFGGTRTYHRMVVNIEDAGFEIRDQVQWLYGSGFPKSHDISKAIDKAAGAKREVLGRSHDKKYSSEGVTSGASIGGTQGGHNFKSQFDITTPSTDDAEQWQGWGTALKPANEPICLARKPLEKGLTIAQNVQRWGTGALNIDAGRIATEDNLNGGTYSGEKRPSSRSSFGNGEGGGILKNGIDKEFIQPQGRWPANIIFDEEAAAILDEQSGALSKQGSKKLKDCPSATFAGGSKESTFYGDSGGASRFFYVAKASKSERNRGLEGEEKQKQGARPKSADASGKFPDHDHRPSGGNNHPTVKPIKLMEYLIKLVTPPGGIVLDPFCGSGSTGVAAKRLGFGFIGIEREAEYAAIAEKRIKGVKIYGKKEK